MNINRPNNYLKVASNNYNLNELQTNKNEFPLDVKKVQQKKKLPEGLIQSLKEWEQSDKLENSGNVRWDLSNLPLKYYANNGFNIEGYLNEFEKIIYSSFMEWSRASYGQIRFIKCISESQADISIAWTNTLILGRDFECGHNNLKVIGNKIEKAEISVVVLPAIDKFSTNINRVERVRRTLLHEIGHSLGLKHSNDSRDIMFHRGIVNKNISEMDAQALIELYKSQKVNEFNI